METIPRGGLIGFAQPQCTSHCQYFQKVSYWFATFNPPDVYIGISGHHFFTQPCCMYTPKQNHRSGANPLNTVSCLLGTNQGVTKMPTTVFGQSQCLGTSDSIFDPYRRPCNRNDRENVKSYTRRIGRIFSISYHFCYHGGEGPDILPESLQHSIKEEISIQYIRK